MKVHKEGVWVGGIPNLLSFPVTVFYNKSCEESERAAKLAAKHQEKFNDNLIASAHWMRKAVNVYDNWWRLVSV